MKDSRIGESLWYSWEGSGYVPGLDDSIIYCTETHVDVEHEIVRKALASCIQRDGVVFSLSQGFQAIDSGIVFHGWAGSFQGEIYQEICDDTGKTLDGLQLSNVTPITIVEVPDLV